MTDVIRQSRRGGKRVCFILSGQAEKIPAYYREFNFA
jgi:hypothetical protein